MLKNHSAARCCYKFNHGIGQHTCSVPVALWFLSDRTNTRYGKRTPYIILGTVFAVILMMFLPVASNKNSLIMFFIALGLVLLAMGSYRSPAVALMPDLTPKRHRSKANAIINLMGALGGIYTLVCIRLLVPDKENPSYTLVFLAVAILMVVSVTILKITINEKKLSKQIKAVDSDFEDEPVTGEKQLLFLKKYEKVSYSSFLQYSFGSVHIMRL